MLMRVFEKKKERRDNCEFFFEALIIVIFCAYPQRERMVKNPRDWLPSKEISFLTWGEKKKPAHGVRVILKRRVILP